MMKIKVILCFCSMFLCINIYAQNKTNDCIVYKNILIYLNERLASIKYGYEGITVPESSDLGKLVELDGLQQYNFYIVAKKSNFENVSVKNWFSKLVKDSTVICKKYIHTEDSIINCAFGDSIKYQYKSFNEIKFSEKDYLQEKRGEMNVYYVPIRITFSKILYTQDSRALVFAKIYWGIGQGRDIYIYGFVLKKSNDDWVLSLTEGEVR